MVTTYDIAREAGVHQSTVSRVLSGSSQVNTETARRVRRACEQLGYVPNTLARSLRTRTTRTLAVHLPLMPGDPGVQAADPFVAMFLKGLSVAAAKHDYSVLLCGAEDQDQDLARLVQTRRADGVVVVSPRLDDPRIQVLNRGHVPCVLGRFDGELGPETACVDIDNQATGRRAAQFCLSRGHERVGLIAEPEDWVTAIHFAAGFREALQAAGHDPSPWIRRGPVTFEAAYAEALDLLGREPAVTAIVATTPLMVFGALEAVRRSGRPVMVLGVDSPLLRYLHPGVPRIVAPVEQLGRAMAEALVRLLQDGSPPPTRLLQTHILDERGAVFEPATAPPASSDDPSAARHSP